MGSEGLSGATYEVRIPDSPMLIDTFMLLFDMAFQVLKLLLDDELSPYAQ